MVGVKSQNTQEGAKRKSYRGQSSETKTWQGYGFRRADSDVVQKDIQGAGVNTTTFPLDQILGFKISLQVLGFKFRMMDLTEFVSPSGPKKNLLKVVKAGDRILS